MSEKKKGFVDVSILGRNYRVTCAEEEREGLAAAVQHLDRKMNEIKATGRGGSTERIAVMAALNIAHELLTAQTSGSFDFGEARRRIAAMQATLDQALAPQEKLF